MRQLELKSSLHKYWHSEGGFPVCTSFTDRDVAIDQHLLENEQYALNYDNKPFSILVKARNSFHLNLLKAVYVETKRPVLCTEKEFVYTLKLFR